MELLAPAGDMDKLRAAVEAGADAVYLAGDHFGARSFAGNFSAEALKEAIDYCHLLGKKAYVTVNTLIKQSEWQALKSFIDHLYLCQADAVIIQDFGVLSFIRQHYPDLACHASTQMTLYTDEGIDFAENAGISRIVLAREVPIEIISGMASNKNIELEVFAHGALCYAVSGQCLMSSMIGGRSGNRGKCAQTCRKTFKIEYDGQLYGQPGYFLSMKDLNTLDGIDALKASGVHALKIEGRMRSPEFVSTVVTAYRQAIDTGIPKWDLDDVHLKLKRAFNRGFTKGYILESSKADVVNPVSSSNQGVFIGTALKNDNPYYLTLELEETLRVGDKLKIVDRDREYGIEVFNLYQKKEKRQIAHSGERVEIDFNNSIKNSCQVFKTYDFELSLNKKSIADSELWKVPVKLQSSILKGKFPKLAIEDQEGFRVEITGTELVSEAMKAPLTEEQVTQQLTKLGDSVYSVQSISLELETGCFMPVKSLNALRREATLALDTLRTSRYQRASQVIQANTVLKDMNQRTGFEKVYYAHNEAQLKALIESGVKVAYYYDVLALNRMRDIYPITLYPALKSYYPPQSWASIKTTLKEEPIISVSNPGQCEAFSESLLTLDTPFNFTNREAIDYFNQRYTVQRAFLSMELNEAEIEHLVRSVPNAGVFFKGRPLVMSTLSCPAKVAIGEDQAACLKCQSGRFELIDEKEARYPFKCLYGMTQIYHHGAVQMDAILHEWKHKAFRALKIELTCEDYTESLGLLQNHEKLGYLGHLYRGVE